MTCQREEAVPLSEEELRLLEQMERALAAEDPKFVSTLQGGSIRRAARARSLGAAAVFVIGIVMMMSGAMSGLTWLGALGFLVMLGSATLGLTWWRGAQVPGEPAAGPEQALFDFDDQPHRFDVIEGGRAKKPRRPKKQQRSRQASSGTFIERMEQRWQRRRDQGF